MSKYIDSLTELDDSFFSSLSDEELEANKLKARLVCEIIRARREKELTQKSLAKMSGVKQPAIARLEKNTSDPQIDTVLKVLRPLGKTLAIVDLPVNG